MPGHFGFHFCHPLQTKLASLASYNVKLMWLLAGLCWFTCLNGKSHSLSFVSLLLPFAGYIVKPCDCLLVFAGFTQHMGIFAVVQRDVSYGNESSVFAAALGRHKTDFYTFMLLCLYILAKRKS